MDETLYTRWMPQLTREQIKAFALYQDMLQDWNSRMNLTAITQPEEVASKHFADSVLPAALLPDIQLTLLDSLQKRIGFLNALCQALGFADVALLHARAEDAGRDPALRGRFDVALSRAVAPFPVLLELTVPFLKVGGKSLMYKGPQAQSELQEGENACKVLHCNTELLHYAPPWGERYVIVAAKAGDTPKAYPRKAGTPAKSPL